MVLDISVHDNTLKMGILLKDEYSVPVRHYSERTVAFAEIERLIGDIISILNKSYGGLSLDEAAFCELKQSGQLLYDYLLTRPVKERLSEYKQAHLIVSVDERLVNIPWELLYDGHEFLSLKFNMARAIRTGSIDSAVRYRTVNDTLKMLILSDPTCDLQSAHEEGLSIKNYFSKNKISVDFKSRNIDKVYLKKNLRDYDIVHYAGHCQYDADNPALSGWILSDGIFHARDFAVIGEALPLPSIIFANACQSAASSATIRLHTNREVYALAQTLLFGGVRHYIGTLWKIEDGAGFILAREFYGRIMEGVSLGEALRLARRELVVKYGLSNVSWANYILYGDPSFVLFRKDANVITCARIKRYLPGKKTIACALAASFIIIIAGLFLYKNLPSCNPATYVLFSATQNYFLKGENHKIIDTSNRIIEKDALFLPAYKMLGDTYFRLGERDASLRYYFEYATKSEKKSDSKNLACAYIKIAWTYHMWGDYAGAREFYDKAMALSVKSKDKLNEADALERLAVWHTDKEEYETAFALLMRSCEINHCRQHNPEHRFNLACDYFSIGYLYFQKDEYAAAKEFFNKSKEIFKSLKATPELSDYYFDMGEIALFEKNYNEAQEFYKKGLELDKKLGHLFNLSSDYQMLGELCHSMKKFSEAEKYFYESIVICRQIDNKPTLAGVYYDLAVMYAQTDKTSQARDYFNKALEIYKHIETPDYQRVYEEYLTLQDRVLKPAQLQ